MTRSFAFLIVVSAKEKSILDESLNQHDQDEGKVHALSTAVASLDAVLRDHSVQYEHRFCQDAQHEDKHQQVNYL